MRACFASGIVRKIKDKWFLVNEKYEMEVPISVDETLSLLEGQYVEIVADTKAKQEATD
jgi:hypothetical protein